MSARTVKVSNVSLKATELDLQEFFSFSGEIVYLEIKSENEESQIAYVTFKDSQGADTAVLLTGATIAEKTVTITVDPDYQLPPGAVLPPDPQSENQGGAQAVFRKAEDVVTSMLAKGFILGKDAINKAKSFDEKHRLTSAASIKIQSLDQKYGLSEKVSMGTSTVNTKVKELDEKYHVSERTKLALAAAEEKVSNARSAIMTNRYVLTGATWVTGAYNRAAQAASDVSQKAREKVDMAEEEQKRRLVEDFGEVNFSEYDSNNVPLEVSTSPKEVSPKAPSSPKAASPKVSSSPKETAITKQPSSEPEQPSSAKAEQPPSSKPEETPSSKAETTEGKPDSTGPTV